MNWTRLRGRRSARRVAVVDDLRFPTGGRQRLLNQHGHLSGDDIHLVEAATRQWFRLVARHPRARLVMPSLVADALWQELAFHARDYAVFCDAAFGRPLTHPPRQAVSADITGSKRAASLLATLGHARRDEGTSQTGLPLLFHLDEDLRIRDGNRYLADCGGRGECFHVPGMICLRHVGGSGKRPRARGIRGDLPFNDGRYGYAGGAFAGGGGAGVESTGGGDGGGGGN
jgi:hypothetical protein